MFENMCKCCILRIYGVLFLSGGQSAFGSGGSAYHGPPDMPMQVLNTDIDCQKTFMNVYFKYEQSYRALLFFLSAKELF